MRLKVKQRKLLEYFGQFPFAVPYIVTGGVFDCGDVAAGALIFVSMHYKAWKCMKNEMLILHATAQEEAQKFEAMREAYSLASFKKQEHVVASVWFEGEKDVAFPYEHPTPSPLLFLSGYERKEIDLGVQALKIDRFIDVVEEDIIPLPKFFDTLFRECQNNETFVSLQ